MAEEFRIDPSSVRKRLEKVLKSKGEREENESKEEIDLDELIDEEKDPLDELLEKEVDEYSDIEELLDQESRESYDNSKEEDKEDESIVDECESVEFDKLEQESKDLESEVKMDRRDFSDLSEESDKDDVDYSFEGYDEIDDPIVEEEFAVAEVRGEFDELLKNLEGADSAIELEEGLYLCHPKHVFSIHDDDIVPETLNLYEVRGVRGFWQHTGIVVPDLETAVTLAKMFRLSTQANTKIQLMSFNELVLLVKDTGIYVLSRLRANPLVYLMNRRIRR